MNNIKDSIKNSVKDIFFRPRVLVVDDEVRIQKACQRLLTEEGYDAWDVRAGCSDGCEITSS
jgi:CheY-like chemotaxis protein